MRVDLGGPARIDDRSWNKSGSVVAGGVVAAALMRLAFSSRLADIAYRERPESRVRGRTGNFQSDPIIGTRRCVPPHLKAPFAFVRTPHSGQS